MGAETAGVESQALGVGLDEIADALVGQARDAKPAALGDGAE
jgi:hypothetical protein